MWFSGSLKQQLDRAEGLIFDMDGTVIDSMPMHYTAWSAVADEYGLNFSRERFYQLGGVPTYETLVILSEESGIEIDIPAAKLKKETHYKALLEQVSPIDEVVEIVHHYYKKKPMAIATGASFANAQRILTKLELFHLFDAIITADHVENHKPAPDVFLLAAEQLQCAPTSCVAFEDTDLGIEAIRAANMIPVDVRTISAV